MDGAGQAVDLFRVLGNVGAWAFLTEMTEDIVYMYYFDLNSLHMLQSVGVPDEF